MTERELFSVVGILPSDTHAAAAPRRRSLPLVPLTVMMLVVLGCVCAPLLTGHDPAYMDLAHCTEAPSRQFWFGTDTMGRDIFACVWYGGRVSLTVGFLAAAISTVIAVVYGAASGMAPSWLDTAMMRLTELLGSVPSLLLVVFLQGMLGTSGVLSLSLVIGVTGWCAMAKVVRTEVRQLRQSGYVIACRCMGGSFGRVLLRHLVPNFVSAIVFMVVMSVSTAIAAEATLSFMGLGLPLEIISWGSMLALAQQGLTQGAWWIIVIPGVFLVAVLVSVTAIGGWLRRAFDRRQGNL